MTDRDDQKYLEYIKNTGGSPKIEWFDYDWEPIGQMVRKKLIRFDLIYEENGKIYLK